MPQPRATPSHTQTQRDHRAPLYGGGDADDPPHRTGRSQLIRPRCHLELLETGQRRSSPQTHVQGSPPTWTSHKQKQGAGGAGWTRGTLPIMQGSPGDLSHQHSPDPCTHTGHPPPATGVPAAGKGRSSAQRLPVPLPRPPRGHTRTPPPRRRWCSPPEGGRAGPRLPTGPQPRPRKGLLSGGAGSQARVETEGGSHS